MLVNSTNFQNNVGKFLKKATSEDIIITKNGKEIARLIGAEKATSFLAESLIGLLPKNIDVEQTKREYFKNKQGDAL
jgi:prevent-host-death family protein